MARKRPTPISGQGGIPAGGDEGAILAKNSGADYDAFWENFSYNGYSKNFSEMFNTLGLKATLDKIINIQYTPSTISLSSSPSTSYREKGTTISSVSLSAHTTKVSDNITSVSFYRYSTLLYTVPSPSATGGTETYTDTTPFSDTVQYSATVSDGTSTVNSNTITYPFVYPYYYGAGSPGLTGTQVAALTKSIIPRTSSVTVTTSPSNQVYYFAYLQSYGALTSILDANGFETIADYIQHTYSIVGLDGTSQSYYVYEFKNLTSQTNFNNTYKL